MAYQYPSLTVAEAARQLGASKQAVRRYCRSGILRHTKSSAGYHIDQVAVLALKKVIQQAMRGKQKPPPPRSGALVREIDSEGESPPATDGGQVGEGAGAEQPAADQAGAACPGVPPPRPPKGPCDPFGWVFAEPETAA